MQGFENSSEFNTYYNVPASPVSPLSLSASSSNDCSYSMPSPHYNQNYMNNYAYNYGYNYSSPASYYYMPNPNGYVAYNSAQNTNAKDSTSANISTRDEPTASSCFYTPSSSYYSHVSVGSMLMNRLCFNILIFCLRF